MPDDLRQQVSYLAGLAEGSELKDRETGKVITGILDVLGRMAGAVEQIRAEHAELEAYVDCLDLDVADLESEIWGEIDAAEEVEAGFLDVVCPECGERVYFDNDLFEEDEPLSLVCPNCGATIYQELAGRVEVIDEPREGQPREGRAAPPPAQ